MIKTILVTAGLTVATMGSIHSEISLSHKQGRYDLLVKQIKKNNKDLDIKYAKRIARVVFIECRKANIDPRIVIAILKQESNYKLNAVNKRSADYGIAQINRNTIKSMRLNKTKLLTDLEYSVHAAVEVLSLVKRYSNGDSKWWARYNSRHLNKKNKYYVAVSRYL